MAQQPSVGQVIENSWSYSDTLHSAGLPCTSDQLVAQTSTWQHTTLTTDIHPCPGRDSNPHSQKASGCRPTPLDRAATGVGMVIDSVVTLSDIYCYLLLRRSENVTFDVSKVKHTSQLTAHLTLFLS